MSIEQIHRAIKLELDKTDSLNYASFLPEEIDYWINQGVLTFVKTRYSGNNAKGEGFEQTQKRIDDLRTLVLDANIPMISKQLGGRSDFYTGTLPSNYMFTVGEEVRILIKDELLQTGTNFPDQNSKYVTETSCVINNGYDDIALDKNVVFIPSTYARFNGDVVIKSRTTYVDTPIGPVYKVTLYGDETNYVVGQDVIFTYTGSNGKLISVTTSINNGGLSVPGEIELTPKGPYVNIDDNPYRYASPGLSGTLYPLTYQYNFSLVSGKCYSILDKITGVTQITIDRYKDTLINPFSEHKLQYGNAWPLRVFTSNTVELTTDNNYLVSNYYLRYLKIPQKFNSIANTYNSGDTLESNISYTVDSGAGVLYNNTTYTVGQVFFVNSEILTFSDLDGLNPSPVTSNLQGLELPEHTHDEIVKITVNKMIENIGYTDRYQTHTIETRSME